MVFQKYDINKVNEQTLMFEVKAKEYLLSLKQNLDNLGLWH